MDPRTPGVSLYEPSTRHSSSLSSLPSDLVQPSSSPSSKPSLSGPLSSCCSPTALVQPPPSSPSSKPSLSGAPSLSRPPRASATGVVLSPCPFSSLNPCLSSLNYGGIPNVVLSLLSPHTCPPSCPCYSLFRGSQVSSRFLWLPWLLLAYYHTITIVLYYCHIQH